MQALLLDGSRSGDELGALRAALEEELRAGGWEAESWTLRDLRIAPCIGCFGCWIRTPGRCTLSGPGDDQEMILRAMLRSDLTILFTPVVFGGYSAETKSAVDRMIPLVLPFFEKRGADHRHPPRYARPLRRIVMGVLPAPDAEAEGIFRRMLHRNALNNFTDEMHSAVVYANDDPEALRAAFRAALPAGGMPAEEVPA
jgi:hypothetical protein